MIHNVDEKISLSEKTNLESEKKLLNYSKDYITGMRDLLTQSQQKAEIEIRALKSIFEANISRLDSKFEESVSAIQESTNEVKAIHNEVRSQYNDLDGFMRENFDSVEGKLIGMSSEVGKSKEKIQKLSQTMKLLISDNVSLIESKVADGLKNVDYKFTKYVEDLNENMRTLSAKVENVLLVKLSFKIILESKRKYRNDEKRILRIQRNDERKN